MTLTRIKDGKIAYYFNEQSEEVACFDNEQSEQNWRKLQLEHFPDTKFVE